MSIRRRAAVGVAVLAMLGAGAAPPAGAKTVTSTATSTPKVSRARPAPSTTRPKATVRASAAPAPAPAASTATPTVAPVAAARATTSAAPAPSTTAATGTITVYAAASLTAPFIDIAAGFEKANPGAKVRLNFAGSSTLVNQIQNGAPADVFASADTANMDRLRAAKLVDATPVIFARNTLMIVVPRGNPLRVRSLADLARPEVFVALGAPGVPVGDYARDVLARAGVEVKPRTLESSVAAIVNKAALKEIDAGIVYVTDVALDEYRVDGVSIPEDANIIATYPIAPLADSGNRDGARAFVAFTRRPAAQAILARYKFLPAG